MLRARRQILLHPPDWALGRDGLCQLTGRNGTVPASGEDNRDGEGAFAPDVDAEVPMPVPVEPDAADPLAEEFAAIDAVLARSTRILEGGDGNARKAVSRRDRPSRSESQNDLVYDPDWDEDTRLEEWQAVLAETRGLPVVLRAAILLEAWSEIEVLQHAAWLGPLFVAALLRQEGLATHHLAACISGRKKFRASAGGRRPARSGCSLSLMRSARPPAPD